MAGRKDIKGEKFGRLTVIEFVGQSNCRQALWKCVCDCGNEKICNGKSLRSGENSCGCLRIENLKNRQITHGKSKTPEYHAWFSMIDRCTNKNAENYKHYGGRGVSVCQRWIGSFENFLEDMGTRPSKKHSLDRFPNNDTGNYEPINCRWATNKEQQQNRRCNVWKEYEGVILVLEDWIKKLGARKSCFFKMIKRKSFEEAVRFYMQKYNLKLDDISSAI